MRFLAVDDEPLMLDGLVAALRGARPEAEILPFRWPEDALLELKKQPADVAFLDIQLGRMTGLQLAVELKKIKPDIHIIFVTGYSQYAVNAFSIHATGYLLKPVEKKDVERELTFIYGEQKSSSHIQVKTFGGFEIFVDGQPVRFDRTKAKELLAYLVDRRGVSVTSGEAYSALFEDTGNTLSGKSYFRTIVHELTRALKKAGIEDILRKEWNSYAVVPEKFDCDFYRFLDGDPAAINQYQNDYLPAYSWAEIHNAELYFRGNETTKF